MHCENFLRNTIAYIIGDPARPVSLVLASAEAFDRNMSSLELLLDL